jgi:D-sedoheptulose 7-phosphate isomerase
MSDLANRARAKAQESADTLRRFFDEQAEAIAECALAMNRRFSEGGRLYAFGNGGSACDAEHVAVEFLHPIIEKREALPATCLGQNRAWLTALGNDQDFTLAYARELQAVARPVDIALGISTSGQSANVMRALRTGRELGLATVGLTGRDGGGMRELCDHCFVVPSFSIHRIQETHIALLHVLWDLIHVARGREDVL